METKAQLRKLDDAALASRRAYAHRQEIAAQLQRERPMVSRLQALQARIGEVQAERG